MKRGEERKKEENLHQKEDRLLKEELLQDQITDLTSDITDLLSKEDLLGQEDLLQPEELLHPEELLPKGDHLHQEEHHKDH